MLLSDRGARARRRTRGPGVLSDRVDAFLRACPEVVGRSREGGGEHVADEQTEAEVPACSLEVDEAAQTLILRCNGKAWKLLTAPAEAAPPAPAEAAPAAGEVAAQLRRRR